MLDAAGIDPTLSPLPTGLLLGSLEVDAKKKCAATFGLKSLPSPSSAILGSLRMHFGHAAVHSCTSSVTTSSPSFSGKHFKPFPRTARSKLASQSPATLSGSAGRRERTSALNKTGLLTECQNETPGFPKESIMKSCYLCGLYVYLQNSRRSSNITLPCPDLILICGSIMKFPLHSA